MNRSPESGAPADISANTASTATGNEGHGRFEVPDGLLPQPEEEPLYKLVAKEYFKALGQFDLAGLRLTLSRRVQDDAGPALKDDIDAMREAYDSITFEVVSWQRTGKEGEESWVCTFHQTLHPKKSQKSLPEVQRNCRIYLVKDKGRWVVEQ